jgi:hypothetical protein
MQAVQLSLIENVSPKIPIPSRFLRSDRQTYSARLVLLQPGAGYKKHTRLGTIRESVDSEARGVLQQCKTLPTLLL